MRERFNTLTAREREVMSLVVKGRFNTRIAADIGVSEVTVKVQRGQVMSKMQAMSLPELARMADAAQLRVPIAKAFPLEQIADAHRLVAGGHVRGKVVVTLG